MDEHVLSELLECSVCLERLDENSKVLPCQHTFCRRCLDEILSTKHELRCPECRALVVLPIDGLPSNILLIRLLEGLKNVNSKAGSGSVSSPANSGSGTSSCSSPSHAAPNVLTPNMLISPPNIVSSSQPCAKALYSYDAKEPGDLSFKKGDLILLKKQVDENWYHGELNGQHGFFPATYVQVLTALSSPQDVPKCTALYDFVINDKDEKDCLTFQKDEMLTVIRRVDDNWVEGKRGDRIGIFPISFVDLNESARWLINNQTSTQTSELHNIHPEPGNETSGVQPNEIPQLPRNQSSTEGVIDPDMNSNITSSNAENSVESSTSSVLQTEEQNKIVNPDILEVQTFSQKRHSLTTLSSPHASLPQTNQQRHSMELPSTFGVTSTVLPTATIPSPTNPAVTAADVNTNVSVHKATSDVDSVSLSRGFILPSCIFVALYNYKPQKEDEIELKKGDYYTVSEKCQDGWFKGTCLRTAKTGVFPGNYVQIIGSMPGKPVTGRPAQATPQSSNNTAAGSSGSTCSVTTTTASASTSSASVSCVVSQNPVTCATRTRATVSRTHSFPHSSPLALVRNEYARNVPHKSSVNHTRTVAQAQSRNILSTSQSQCKTVSANNSNVVNLNAQANAVGSSLPHAAHQTDKSSANANSTSTTHSPRTSRKTKHSHGQHSVPSTPAHQFSRGSSVHGRVEAAASTVHHSISTTTTVTPPNVVVGATGSAPSGQGSANGQKEREKDKKEKRERFDKLGLVKRLTSATSKGKKSKSPPPESSDSDHAVPTSQPTPQKRSGSLPASSEEHTSAALSVGIPPMPQTQHKKSSSADGAVTRPAKVKPFVRERYRCIVPYPPQSDLELELKPGDVVFVMKKREDGWYKGLLQRTGKTGLFPRSFVESF